MAGAEDFASDSDAFFDQLMSDAGLNKSPPTTPVAAPAAASAPAVAPPASSPAPTPSDQAHAAEAEDDEFAELERSLAGSAAARDAAKAPAKTPMPPTPAKAEAQAVATFALDDGDGSGDEAGGEECDVIDYRPPAVPDAPPDFTEEDRKLREVLIEFYLSRRAENISNVNLIVKKYRGSNVAQLWAMLAMKYEMPPVEAVEYLARTLYLTSPFEYASEERVAVLERDLIELREDGVTDPAVLLSRAVQRGANDGLDGALRVLVFRGVPDGSDLRPQAWKVLLGYLPMPRYSEWNAIQGEKRADYTRFRDDFLVISDDHSVQAKEGGSSGAEDLLREIEQDVNRTRRDCEYFNRAGVRSSLTALLFVYARLNPGVRYVQGMNEVAAVLMYVMSVDPGFAEADAFWCFSELMVEIKEGFMQALDHSSEGIHAWAASVQSLLYRYDPVLTKHLQEQEISLILFILRWCTVLFAQDATLPNVVRLWDSMIADPKRFELCLHLCISSILEHRQQLLESKNYITLAEILQSAPQTCEFQSQVRRAWAICAFERRAQNPPFPPLVALGIDEISELLKESFSRAQEAIGAGGAEAAKHIQEHIAPAVQEKAAVAAAVAAEKAQEAQKAAAKWMEETAPARQEALEKAQTHFSSFWGALVEKTSELATKGQELASEHLTKENAEQAQVSASAAVARGAAIFQPPPRAGGADDDDGPPPLLVVAPDAAEDTPSADPVFGGAEKS